MQNLVSIDGTYYDLFIPQDGIKRSFKIGETNKAGTNVLGGAIRDIIGTYYSYTMPIYFRKGDNATYMTVYNILSAPTEFHTIVMPFNNGTITFDAYIKEGSDQLTKIDGYGNRWKGLTISFEAKEPQWRVGEDLQGVTE